MNTGPETVVPSSSTELKIATGLISPVIEALTPYKQYRFCSFICPFKMPWNLMEDFASRPKRPAIFNIIIGQHKTIGRKIIVHGTARKIPIQPSQHFFPGPQLYILPQCQNQSFKPFHLEHRNYENPPVSMNEVKAKKWTFLFAVIWWLFNYGQNRAAGFPDFYSGRQSSILSLIF